MIHSSVLFYDWRGLSCIRSDILKCSFAFFPFFVSRGLRELNLILSAAWMRALHCLAVSMQPSSINEILEDCGLLCEWRVAI